MILTAQFSRNKNLIVEITNFHTGYRTGRKLLYKREILEAYNLPLDDLESPVTITGHSAVEWLVHQVTPSKVLAKGHIVR